MTNFRSGILFQRTRWLLSLVLSCGLLSSGFQILSAGEGKSQAPSQIDIKASHVYIYVGKVGLGHEHAVVGQLKSGVIRIGAPSDAGKIVFDMTSFVADTQDARKYIGLKGTTSDSMQRDVTANMQGEHVLDVARYPTAVFEITAAASLKTNSANNHPQYRIHGDFTLHGVKQPVQFDAEVIEQRGQKRVLGSFRIQQTAFGITPYSKAFGTIGVSDELTIYGDLILSPQGAPGGKSAAPK